MSGRIRIVFALLDATALLLGLACLNYTKADTIEYHRKWAVANNFPPPTPTIFFVGVVLVSLGSGTMGFTVGCTRRRIG